MTKARAFDIIIIIGMRIYGASRGVIMNEYRYILAMLSDDASRAARIVPARKGAEV